MEVWGGGFFTLTFKNMAFYAHYEDNSGTTWHIGSHAPNQLTDNNLRRIVYLQADGDELAYIVSSYTVNGHLTIPLSTRVNVVRWYGDLAKTIAYNL